MQGVQIPKPLQLGPYSTIGPEEKCFIIAEIGQNHQGDLNLAKQMIRLAKESGADCVKFQKSNLQSKFNKKALSRPYIGPNSWGETYGLHKEFLEFSDEQFAELKKFSDEECILFSSSVMDEISLKFIHSLNVHFIKIGSGDAHNKKLLLEAVKIKVPLIVSTGMCNMTEVVDIYNLLKDKNADFCLLHCVSSYPVPFEEINLNVINSYKKMFPDINIGYSGHEVGIDIAIVAVALGAKIIEKHFTLDKSLKGSDHVCSLTPTEFKNMVSQIRCLEKSKISLDNFFTKDSVQKALGVYEKKFQPSEKACFEKLGKTVVAAKKLEKGDILTWEKISLKVSEPKGIPGKNVDHIIGRVVNAPVEEDESISESFLN